MSAIWNLRGGEGLKRVTAEQWRVIYYLYFICKIN